jgi:Ni/Fe-hydrogenase subunit HybB-like protein
MNMVSLLAKIYVYTPSADLIQDIALISIIVIAVIAMILLLTVKFIDSITRRKEQAIETWEGDGNAAKSSID